MSRPITQPVNQVRLTNVAVVRMNRCGKRFEVACYRNKIVNYRQGIETDLSEVLQTDRVFSNVSKGRFANSSDLRRAFGTTDEEEVCRTILTRGQVQVSDMERSAQLESTRKEVAAMVAAKCVDPSSDRPYTAGQIRDAMRRCGFMVHPTRGVKQQFLDCVRLLREKDALRIERAKMELCVVAPSSGEEGGAMAAAAAADVERRLKEAGAIVVDAPLSSLMPRRIVVLIDPSLYRTVDGLAKDGGCRLEILRQCVTEEGDVELESELQRKSDRQRREGEAAAGAAPAPEAAPAPVAGAEAGGGDAAALSSSSDGEGDDGAAVAALGRRVEEAARVSRGDGSDDGNDEDGDEDEEDGVPAPAVQPASNARKQSRRAQKQSKKAKRREREERAEREARAEAERARRRERAERLGLEEAGPNAEAGAWAGAGAEDARGEEGDGNGGPSYAVAAAPAPKGELKACNTCGGAFPPAGYRAHFRSDWHRYNVKLRMGGSAPVTEREFELCDADAFFDGGGSLS